MMKDLLKIRISKEEFMEDPRGAFRIRFMQMCVCNIAALAVGTAIGTAAKYIL